MNAVAHVPHLVALLTVPILFVGLLNRTKAFWGGRKGPPLLQTFFDLARLIRKQPVYSEVTTSLFQFGPLVLLATTLVAGLFAPLLGTHAPLSFAFDFVAMAYLWALGRVFLVLPALDTGSAFEGMGASREATYGALVEPVLFLAFGTLVATTGQGSLGGLLRGHTGTVAQALTLAACVFALWLVLQIDSARLPVDDPSTHLELTMIHEVMILDHSGPELAALQYAAAMKMTCGASILAALVNPFLNASDSGWVVAGTQLALTLAVAVAQGTVESLMARFKLRALPRYVLAGMVVACVALFSAAWQRGGGS